MSSVCTQSLRRSIIIALLAMMFYTSSGISYTNQSQVVIPLESRKSYRYWSDSKNKTISLEIQQINPEEVRGLEFYDDRFIRRVQTRSIGNSDTEIQLTLKDHSIGAAISYYDEPSRIVIDLFSKNNPSPRDPLSSYPLALSNSQNPNNSSEDHQPQLSPDKNIAEQLPKTSHSNNNQRVLFQAPQLEFENESELVAALNKTPDGLGRYWNNYPRYIYRLQSSLLDSQQLTKDPLRTNISEALSNTESLADYAGRLYDFGHEAKSLMLYQHVLKQNPNLFSKQPLHLWRFAEAHLSHGNLSLASGYYNLLIDKFPGHDLVGYSKLRLIDVELIRNLQNSSNTSLAEVSKLYAAIPSKSSELNAQIAIRESFLNATPNSDKIIQGLYLPIADEALTATIKQAIPNIETIKTSFFAHSLSLYAECKSSSSWSREFANRADAYFKRFSGEDAQDFREQLSECTKNKLEQHLQKLFVEKNSLSLINSYEELPTSMKSVIKNLDILWILAESYKGVAKNQSAINLYEKYFNSQNQNIEKLNAFIAMTSSAESEYLSLNSKIRNERSQKEILIRKVKTIDDQARRIFETLDQDTKDRVYSSNRNQIEKHILNSSILTSTHPLMTLNAWTKNLSSEKTTGSDTGPNGTTQISPTASSLKLITSLAEQFKRLSDNSKRQETLKLLSSIKPNSSNEDQKTKDLWANELYKLANEYREDNRFLDAGRLYTQIADGSGNWPQRAEALYRGGLMLFRAGQKNDAIEAFKKASEDSNSLFYANLAKERLSQLEP